MERQRWTAHAFATDIDPGWGPNVLARLAGTGIRLRHYAGLLGEEQSAKRRGERWSVKEHIGHLIDLEDLHMRRLDEFARGALELTGADMSNARTHAADHNATPVNRLLERFDEGRDAFIARYQELDEDALQHQARHPRLKVQMRPVDLLAFVAEHDDHHIASILEIMAANAKPA